MKQSSDATAAACESLIVRNYTKAELLQGSTNEVFIEAEEIDQVFDEHFLSSCSTAKLLDDIISSLAKLKDKQACSQNDIEVIYSMICSGQGTLLRMKLTI